MQQKTGKIISRNRFCEFEKSDMEWAEPLGLAYWETGECHAFSFDDRWSSHRQTAFAFPALLCDT